MPSSATSYRQRNTPSHHNSNTAGGGAVSLPVILPIPSASNNNMMLSSVESLPRPQRIPSISNPLNSSMASEMVMMDGAAGNSTTNASLAGGAFPLLDAPSSFRKQPTPVVPGVAPARSLPNQSKLFVEVERLNSRGLALIRRDGSEAEGVALLGKALWARTRFPVLQKEGDGRMPWEHGEQFVVVCNQIASRLVQTLQQASAHTANKIFACAESALLPGGDEAADSFADFHPLRQHLLGATLNTVAALQKLNGEPVTAIIPTLERAVRLEGGRYSTLSLYNLGAAYLQAKQYDQACRAVATCIDLADHYLSMPTTDHPAESLKAFQQDVATHAVLGHLLLVTIGLWTKTLPVALKHAKLALACALMYLGEKNALTTRCADRLDRVKHVIDRPATSTSAVRDDVPPAVPFHVPIVGAKGYPPSQLLPYALVLPLPDGVQDYVDGVLSRPDVSLLRGDVSVVPRLVEREVANTNNSPSRAGRMLGGGNNALDDTGRLFSQQSILSSSILLPEVTSSVKSSKGGLMGGTRSSSHSTSTRAGGAPSSARGPTRATSNASSTERQTRSTTPRGQALSAAAHHAPAAAKVRPNPQLQPLLQQPVSSTTTTTKRGNSPGTTKSAGSSDCWSPTHSEGSHPTFDASSTGLIPKPPSRGEPLRGDSRGGLQRNYNHSSSAVRLHQQAARTTSPVASSFATTTVLPKAQLLTYQQLQAEVQSTLRPTSRPPGSSRGEGGRGLGGLPYEYITAQKNVTTQLRGPAFANRLGSQRALLQSVDSDSAQTPMPYSHTSVQDVLRISDAQLRQLSVLVPDHTDADEVMWHHCATMIQKVFRSYRVRKYVARPRREASRRWIAIIPAAERILLAWQNFVACRQAVALKYRLRRERYLRDAAIVVQTCARQHLGELELRRRWMMAANEHIQRLRRVQLVASSAVFLQAWWRGSMIRQGVQLRNRAARRIQRTYRIFRLFLIVRLAVLRRRMRKREFCKLLFETASHIQRWWHHYLPQRRAMQELRRRQEALSHHMVDFLARDRLYWESVSHLDDDACRVIVQRWSAAYFVRRRLYRTLALKRQRLNAARVVQRWYRFIHSRHSLNRRVLEYQQRKMIKRRAEEVREAVYDVQRCSRGLEDRLYVHGLRVQATRRQSAALTIQRAARRMIRRGAVRTLRARDAYLSQCYVTAQTRAYSATQIQSTWRMFASKRSTGHFKQFMQSDRHIFAAKIQRLVRYVQAATRANTLRRVRAESLVPRYHAEERYCAARRIQCAARMMICRNALRHRQRALHQQYAEALVVVQQQQQENHEEDHIAPLLVKPPRRLLFPTAMQRRVAALRIQTTWRRFAALMYTNQLRQATTWIDAERIAEEHLHAYATVLQCAVRRYIITPIKLTQARQDREIRSAAKIQRAVKLYLDRRRTLLKLLQQEEEEVLQWLMEEHNFAAIRVQKHIRGFITRSKYEAFRHSVVTAQAVARGYLARRQRAERQERRSIASADVLAAEEMNAAVTIQRAWRGASASPSR